MLFTMDNVKKKKYLGVKTQTQISLMHQKRNPPQRLKYKMKYLDVLQTQRGLMNQG